MQGSPASSIIFAWLLRDLPDPGNVAIFMCFDNIAIAGASRADIERAMDTLADYFSRSPAGSLALCKPEYFDHATEPMEFLGYAFDAALEEPTIGSTPLDRLEARLTAAEEVDQRRENMIPVATWRALRAFRHGFPAVTHNDPTLRTYVEASADSLAGFYSDWARELHDHIFDLY